MNTQNLDCIEIVNKYKANPVLLNLKKDYYQCFPDEDLIEIYLNSNLEEAFNELVDRHGERILRTALRITGDMNAAEEILQNVFIALFHSLPKFRNDSKFTTWLYKIITNTSFMYLRSKKSINRNEISIEDITRFDKTGYSQDIYLRDLSEVPENKFLHNELNELLDKSVNELPDKYRVVFQLKDIEGMTNQEVAEILGLSVSAVKSRVLRARTFLRNKLSEHFPEFNQ